ncbi:beta-xylosidase [Bifidobacterium ramosum]|uniref:Beta-xylosidase n=1 Tax=Bifidobacterium ramosum TaxID=1798158 RepID=A0A6L4X1A6_9BIFI|nr:glycoside hydrolase family 43 protein [Bifidobacterium ramosum]KAB8288398.1 beta-xylosidase [Bifidobacterium ramosum]NEG71567.1 family 43 glycosylhydrolase [Bifidobacterium ramosum]
MTQQSTSAVAQRYTNPLQYADGVAHTAPDPFVLEYLGEYWCYSSCADGVQVSRSADLVHWDRLGTCYTEAGRKEYWAPSVILIDGTLYMYVSDMPEDSDNHHEQIMRVATADRPEGPFECVTTLFDGFAIDSQVVRGADGTMYLLYADNQRAGVSLDRPGTSVMIDRLDTPTSRVGNPRPLILPTRDEEIFARNRFGDGRDWHTIEGATLFTHRDQAYITYSGNSFTNETYFVGYAQAALSGDTPLDELDWRKHAGYGTFDPLIHRRGHVEGTGHNSIIKAPNGVDDWIIYHARERIPELSGDETERRQMCIDPIDYMEGELRTVAPTRDPQWAPAKPDVEDMFGGDDRDLHDDGNWRVLSGMATVSGHQLETSLHGVFRAILREERPWNTYLASFWAKASTADAGGRFGFAVAYKDERNHAELVWDAGDRRFRLLGAVDGVHREFASSQREMPYLDPAQWHRWAVTRTFGTCELRVDDMPIIRADIPLDGGAIGLFSQYTSTRFAAMRVTDHADLWGERLADIGRELRIVDGALSFDERGARVWKDRPVRCEREFLPPSAVQSTTGVRYVFDVAFDRADGTLEIMLPNATVTADAEHVGVTGDEGSAMPAAVERTDNPAEARRDRYGRILCTIIIETQGGTTSIRTREVIWTFDNVRTDNERSVAENRLTCTLNGASLTGYCRTSINH